MRPSKVVKACAIVVESFVVIICMMNFSNEEDVELISSSHVRATQDYSRVTVDSVVNQIENSDDNQPSLPGIDDSTTPPSDVTIDISSWLSVVDSVHKQWGASGFIYSQTTHAFTEQSGNVVTVRTDCSGYVSYCLYVAGYVQDTMLYTSRSDFSTSGFTKVFDNGCSISDLQPGDIVVWPKAHVQIYAGPGDDWYNWGSHYSCQDKYVNVTDISSVDSQIHTTYRSLSGVDVYRQP